MKSRTKQLREKLLYLSRDEILKLGNTMEGVTDFSPASDHFYNRVLENMNKSVDWKLNRKDDNLFFDWMYAALVAWRMNRGKNRVIEFLKFKEELIRQKFNIMKVEDATILNISNKQKNILKSIFQSLHLIKTRKNGKYVPTRSIIVSNSKTLHFILPNLVPPIDNAYTGTLFSLIGNTSRQTRVFIEILDFYKKILIKHNITKKDLIKNNRIPKTIGKFMDDVVITFIKKYKP